MMLTQKTKSSVLLIEDAIKFYGNLENIIEDGRFRVYGNRSNSMRHPEGVQVLTRQTEDEMSSSTTPLLMMCSTVYLKK